MADRAQHVADVAAQMEMVLQKFERKLRADNPGEYRYQRFLLTGAVLELADTLVNGVGTMATTTTKESANDAVAVQAGQLPDLKKPTTAVRFAEMWSAGKLDSLSSGQQAIFLAALGEHIGVKAELGDIMLYQGKPYITISGYRRIAHNTGLLNGVTVEPASDRDRLRFGANSNEYLWVARVYRKGSVRPYEGWGYVRANDKNPVTRTHPQEMAKKRAIYDALRLAFPPAEIIGDLHLTYIEEAERDAERVGKVNALAASGYAGLDEETVAEDEVVATPSAEQLEDREFQDDRHLVD